MKKIHVLPTEKPSIICKVDNVLVLSKVGTITNDIKSFLIRQHIYITSNKKIKEGVNQWYLDKFINKPRNSGGSQYGEKQDVIILTTDQDLIKDGVQAIDDDFLEWFVKNPSCEEVKVTKIQYNPVFDEDDLSYDGMTAYYNYKIIIPKEETIDEGEGEAYRQELFNYLYDNFGAIASELEMRDIEIIVLSTEALKDKQELEKEMFELEQELDIPSNLRWHNSKPKQETLEELKKRFANDKSNKDIDLDYQDGIFYGIEIGAKWQ